MSALLFLVLAVLPLSTEVDDMATTQSVTDQYGTYYYIDSSSSRDRLTWEQMQTNATYFKHYCDTNYPTWTLEAISAILGNVQSEGIMNPSQWEYGYGMSTDYGYGIVQWTPAAKYLDWAEANNFDRTALQYQIARLDFERQQGLQYYPTTAYNFSFTSFLTEAHTVDELARAWLYNYERPGDPAASEAIRVSQANTWFEYLSGDEPDPPIPPDPPPEPPTPIASSGLKPCYYHRRRYD